METSPRQALFRYIASSAAEGEGDNSTRQRGIPMNSRTGPTPLSYTTNKSKRTRQEMRKHFDIDVESELLQLCRSKDWANVIRRCRSNPEEAAPEPALGKNRVYRSSNQSSNRCANASFFDFDCWETIFCETPLGIACASSDVDRGIVHDAVMALILACPFQVRASQYFPGHTPLRDAVLNPCCDVELLRALLDAEEFCCEEQHDFSTSALAMKDRSGHLPIDHLVMGVQLGNSFQSMALFREYFGHNIQRRISREVECSPLISLFTIGSFPASRTIESRRADETLQTRRILEATKFVLEIDQSLLFKYSKLTDCSPLHAALRNFGNCLPLINVLTARPGSSVIMEHRNRYGDLPLHVACSAGVSFEVLSRIVDCTIAATRPYDLGSPFTIHPFLWSVNNAGYTPVDLELVRHIDGGQGCYSTRSFHHIETSDVRRHGSKPDYEYYRDLLQEAVDHTMRQENSFAKRPKSDMERHCHAKDTFGSLLDRIALLVTAASAAIPTTRSPTLLHNVFKLCSIRGPSLPGPLIELFLWRLRDQVLLKDANGMVPLHYAISRDWSENTTEGVQISSQEWTTHVLKLLSTEPAASKETTKMGRLPLHILLDQVGEHSDNSSIRDIAQELVRCFPESVDRPDPFTGLDPFVLAAADLDLAFFLLRRSPSRCARGRK